MRLSCFADGPDVGSRCAFLDRLQVGFFFEEPACKNNCFDAMMSA